MDTKIRVGDVMTRNFVHTHPESTLLECARLMSKNKVGSLVLKSGDELKGIITEKDIVWALTKKGIKELGTIRAEEVANKKIHTIKPEESIHSALEKMNRNKLRRMPVVSNKKVIGYITMKDIVKFIPSIFQESREFEKIKEETEKIQRSESAMKGRFIESVCEECGNYDILTKVDGRMICESCKDEM